MAAMQGIKFCSGSYLVEGKGATTEVGGDEDRFEAID